MARKTIGWDDNGKQIYQTIGYYETRAKGMAGLAEYNKKPFGSKDNITLKVLYEEWSESKYPTIEKKTSDGYVTAWAHLKQLESMIFRDIKKSHLQEIINGMNSGGLSKSSMQKVRVLANSLFKHALADDIVDKNYAELVEMPKTETKKAEWFSDLEVKKIDEMADSVEWIDTILILIYTGLRISELLELTRFNVDMKNMVITGGVKTDAGKDRIIPIHPKIQKHVLKWYKLNGPTLIFRNNERILQNYYRKYLYYPVLESIGVRKLKIHSTRHTFASMMNRAGVNTTYQQKLIGHSDYSTTANIYTHSDIDELRRAIEQI